MNYLMGTLLAILSYGILRNELKSKDFKFTQLFVSAYAGTVAYILLAP